MLLSNCIPNSLNHITRHLLRHRWQCSTTHTQITLNLAGRKLQHLLGQRRLHPNPEGFVHHIIGVAQIPADAVVGTLHIWLTGQVTGKQ